MKLVLALASNGLLYFWLVNAWALGESGVPMPAITQLQVWMPLALGVSCVLLGGSPCGRRAWLQGVLSVGYLISGSLWMAVRDGEIALAACSAALFAGAATVAWSGQWIKNHWR